jgi:formate/nitrite transporter FocA (FNT family)
MAEQNLVSEINKDITTPVLKKKRGCGKYIGMFLVVFLLVGSVIFWWKYYYTYSDGFRSGMLQKLSHKGNLMKTYEGELVLSSIASTSGVALASEKFFFSIANDSLAKNMMNLEGKKVRVHYQQKKGTLPWRGESPYIVDGVSVEP